MKTYTAKEWLEKTLPEGGEWRRANNHDYFYWFPSPVEDWCVVFYRNGRVYGTYYTSPSGREIISRSTAIDLMVSAIEAGEVSEKASNPYAHLPHGGWWATNSTFLFHWPNETDAGQRFSMEGALSTGYDSADTSCLPWEELSYMNPKLTRDQAIAIIEKHRKEMERNAIANAKGDADEDEAKMNAMKKPTPAPAFGGPHDAEAVKWAEERGYQVVAWRLPKRKERYIYDKTPNSERWNAEEASFDFQIDAHYILAPLAQPEPEQGKDIDRQKINDICDSLSRTMADHFNELLAELRKEGECK